MTTAAPTTSFQEESVSVYYRGRWTADEHAVVEAAVKQVEATLPAWNNILGKPWVCLCVTVGTHCVYLAHRMGGEKVLKATSAQDLAEEIVRRHGGVPQETLAA